MAKSALLLKHYPVNSSKILELSYTYISHLDVCTFSIIIGTFFKHLERIHYIGVWEDCEEKKKIRSREQVGG